MGPVNRVKLRYELWAILGGGGLLLILIALDVDLFSPVLGLLRLALGLVFVLVVPGYLLQAAIFRRINQIDGFERATLSLILSIAVIPPLALLLDLLPFAAINLPSILISESFVIAVLWAISWYRRMRILRDHRFAIAIPTLKSDARATASVLRRPLNVVLLTLFVLVVSTITAIVLFPAPAQEFTEFYVLTERGLTEGIPRAVAVDTPQRVIIGVISSESDELEYSVEVVSDEQLLAAVDAIHLSPGERFETTLEFALSERGRDREVDLLLYRRDVVGPYRQLRLIFDVN